MKISPGTAVSFFGYSMILCLQAVEGAEIPKIANSAALNLTNSWSGDVVPGSGDVALWGNQSPALVSAVTSLAPLSADLSFAGIKVTNVGEGRNAATKFVGYYNASSANTLTIGASGIDCSAALQSFVGSSKISLGANQTWNVGDANTNVNPGTLNNNEDIAFIAQAAATPFNFGGKTLTTTGAGQITLSSGYTLSNGSLVIGNNLMVIQGGSSRTTTNSADLNIAVNTGGTLRIQANSGSADGISLVSASPLTVNNGGTFQVRSNATDRSVTQSGNVTLSPGSTLTFQTDSSGVAVVSGGIAVSGATTFRTTGTVATNNVTVGNQITGNLSGTGTITYLNSATNSNGHINLSGTNSGFTGTFDVNGTAGNRRLLLSGANSGSAAATWNVAAGNTLQVNGVSVQLGTLTGAGVVTNSSLTAPATLNIGAGVFSGVISDNPTPQLTGINKIGAGKLELLGANTYSGPTTVQGGQLVVTTSLTSSSLADFTVADSTTLSFLQAVTDSTASVNNLTVGATTGSTLEIALGSQSNPGAAPIYAANLQLNGANKLLVSGSHLSAGTFDLIQYDGAITGTGGFNGLTLKLPPRTLGSLSNVSGVIRLTIDSTEQIKWNGNLSDNWDIDPDGTAATGTANWKTIGGGAATRYLQGSAGNDVVTFDDDASGTGTVNLTTVLSPGGITVNNSAKSYTFTGIGKITGSIGLIKSGSGTLTLANSTANDYSGGTTINAGTLRLGDGVTPGGGSIYGNITNNGTLILNRPDDFLFGNVLSGTGTLQKDAANTVTVGATTSSSPIVVNAGKLLYNNNINQTLSGPLTVAGGEVSFTNGGTLAGPVILTSGVLSFTNNGTISGEISGAGTILTSGGTLNIQGTVANTNTGLVTVSGGLLKLMNPAGVNAVGGDITIQGAGTLAILSNEQIPDTATLNVLGSSADSLATSTGIETVANVNLNGSAATTQLVMRNSMVITGTGTVTQGILGVASNNTATVNAVVLNSPTAILRLAGSSNPSVLNIGAGGITASAGSVQVKFDGNNFDATLNLTGGLTTTGNFAITNAGYTGASLNIINLMDGAHTFNIGAATTTTVAPDIGSTGSLVKSGGGTLTLNASCIAAHTGGTTVDAGTLLVNGTLQGATTVAASGTLGGTGTLAGATTVNGTLAPGVTAGKLTTSAAITLAAGSKLAIDIASWTGITSGTDWDQLAANTLTLAATSGNKLTVRIAGSPTGFTETAKTLVIATSTNPLSGFDASAIQVDATAFSGAGTWTVQKTGNTLELVYAPSAGTPYSTWATAKGLGAGNNAPGLDPDQDGAANFLEFALNGNPLSGTANGKVAGKVATVGGEQALTLTIPVRSVAAFTGGTEKTLTVDGLTYRVQGSDALSAWDLIVTEVTGTDATTIQSTLPALDSGWFYRTFRSPGPIVGDPADFLRVRVDSSN